MSNYNQVSPATLGSTASTLSTSAPGSSTTTTATTAASNGSTDTDNDTSNQLPGSLTRFVQYSHGLAAKYKFDSAKTFQMQLQLKELIEKAQRTNKIWENDWNRQKIPILTPGVRMELHCNLPQKTKGNVSKPPKGKRPLDGDNDGSDDSDLFSNKDRKRVRAQRFEKELSSSYPTSPSIEQDFHLDSNQPIKGTCQNLEKSYFRLTSAPDPSKVRPLFILKKAHAALVKKYNEGAKYSYVCDQFKAIRQDLTVQLIEDDFTVIVYETHARIAIENKDLGEFNQCQSVLQKLYTLTDLTRSQKTEFLSYAVLYYLFTKNYDSITAIKLRLDDRDATKPTMTEAMAIVKAKLANNYHKLLKLYSNTSGTTRKLMDCFINTERVRALAVMCSAYKLLSLEFLLSEFHFQAESDCMQFISEKQIDKFIELRGDNVYLNAANARPTILQYLQQSKKVDIKGQV